MTIDHKSAFEIFRRQRDRFAELLQPVVAKDWQAASSKSPSHTISLSFAEDLLLCPSEDSARSCIEKDPAAARIFLISADRMDVAFAKLGLEFLSRRTDNDAPFFILGAAVKEYLEDVRANFPQLWVA